MNRGVKVLAGLLGVVAVELVPVTIASVRVLRDGIELTYSVEEDALSAVESELEEAERVAADGESMIEEVEL